MENNLTKLIDLPANKEQGEDAMSKNINLNWAFNEIIESFCEIIVLYRELFVRNKGDQNPIFAKSSIIHKSDITPDKEEIEKQFMKSLFNNENEELDLEKSKSICLKILNKMDHINQEQHLELLNLKLKSEIEKYSKFIKFYLKDKVVLHGQTNGESGTGHLINYPEFFEFYGRLANQTPSGQGIKWKGSDYYLQGYFNNGKLCGFGQKKYSDGSFYR